MRYRTIVADPPWPTTAGPLAGREGFLDADGASRPLPYSTMTTGQISHVVGNLLEVAAGRVEHKAHLYLWTTNGFLPEAFEMLDQWGFNYSTTLVWAKNLMGGGLGGAYGISTEFCLYARRGKPETIGRVGGTWFNWKRPYDERGKPMHSAKPDAFQDMVETVSPGPYWELFARRARLGWDSWGHEALGRVDQELRRIAQEPAS